MFRLLLWRISLRYLLSHKRQSGICVAGVTISVMMFLAMFAMMRGFRDKFILETVESSGHLVVNDEPREARTPILERAYGGEHALLRLDRSKPREQIRKIKNPTGLMRKLRSLPGVEAVAPEVIGDAIASYGSKTMNVSIVGIEPAAQQKVTTIGEKLIAGDFERLYGTADGVVIGKGVSTMLGAGEGDSIVLASATGGRVTARIVGVFETGVTPVDYSRAYMLLNNAQTLLDKKNVVNRLTVRIENYIEAPKYATQIEGICGYKTESWQESNSNFLSIFAIQDLITYIITGALLVVSAFGVLNILIMAVLERVNDIAILKSFGFTRRDITLIFLEQGIVIGLIGAVLGLAGGKIAISLLGMIPVKTEGLVSSERLLLADEPGHYAIALVASLIAVLIAAVYPARRAAKADPVQVIRGAH
jgi:lipoprotein-releasing system permease protein